MPTVSVDIGISKCIETLDAIAARRAARKESYFSNLHDDLAAASEIVRTLDNLFITLVSGFMDPLITNDKTALSALMQETGTCLHRRDLLPRLETLTGCIEACTKQNRIRKNEELASSLVALVDDLKRYRALLGSGSATCVGQTKDWNLMTLTEEVQGYASHPQVTLNKMAKQVHDNQDFHLSDAIHEKVGWVQGLAKGELA